MLILTCIHMTADTTAAEPIKKHNNTDKKGIEDETANNIQVFVFIVQNNGTTASPWAP